jgi:Ring finger domain
LRDLSNSDNNSNLNERPALDLDDIERDILQQTNRPTLLLKTRIYTGTEETSVKGLNEHRSVDDVTNENEHASCTICFGYLEDGDRIGVLPRCKHIFHVDCLKGWLKRRNVCPLCLQGEAAERSQQQAYLVEG